MLFALPEDPTPGLELLDPSKLDYSVNSLAHLDDYLDILRDRDLTERDAAVVVMRAGAYVGEVIRRSSGRTYHWLDYEEAVKVDRRIGEMGGKSFSLVAILWDGRKGFVFPLAKVVKFVENGREDSTEFFAQAIIAAYGLT
jgi:hypothetical protein